MAESVDALVSNTSGATRAGSTPALGTERREARFSPFLLSPFDYSYPIDTRWRINFVRHFYEYKKTKNCITKRASGFRTYNVMILKPLN